MSFVSLYLYVPDEGSLLPKYRDCTTSNDFELYIYIYIFRTHFRVDCKISFTLFNKDIFHSAYSNKCFSGNRKISPHIISVNTQLTHGTHTHTHRKQPDMAG